MAPITIYDQQINDYKAEISQVQQNLSRLGWFRLLCFIAASGCGYGYFSDDFEIIWLLPVVLLIGGFLFGLVKYQSAYEHLTLLKALLDLNEKEWRLPDKDPEHEHHKRPCDHMRRNLGKMRARRGLRQDRRCQSTLGILHP